MKSPKYATNNTKERTEIRLKCEKVLNLKKKIIEKKHKLGKIVEI